MQLNYSESVLSFSCQGENLLGVVSAPKTLGQQRELGVIIVVGGPQYRAGSHRLFVRVARSLAGAGFTTMRFDYSGMGDSGGAQRDFLAVSPDINASIEALVQSHPDLKRIVLFGLCDAASASLLYCEDYNDPRICGLVLLNPWVRSEQSLARTQVKHYYLQRLRQPEFWKKLLSGRVAASALGGLAGNLKTAIRASANSQSTDLSFQSRMARAWADSRRPILLVLSEQDHVAKEFLEICNTAPDWQGMIASTHVDTKHLTSADHTISAKPKKDELITTITAWLGKLNPTPRGENKSA